jgi:hypothetical protein
LASWVRGSSSAGAVGLGWGRLPGR